MFSLTDRSNPFVDSVKDIARQTTFVAVGAPLRTFKEGVMEIIDTSRPSANTMHAIIGDVGSGKSHMNHYLYYKARESEDILTSYVSCKGITQDTHRGKSLYNRLLNAILQDLKRNSPEDLRHLIDERYQSLSDDIGLKQFKKDHPEPIEEYTPGVARIYEALLNTTELNMETFFAIIDCILKDSFVESKISRLVFIVDEFELFAEEHHSSSLAQVWAMREEITRYPKVVWVFSCLARSWTTLSEVSLTKDMFGKQNITESHFIPPYDKEDRLEIIWSRMLSTVPGYVEESRDEYQEENRMAEYCFPFYNKKSANGRMMNGTSITEMIARPALSPRTMMLICYDYYGFYLHSLDEHAEEDAFYLARTNLFSRHVFDLVNPDMFNALSDSVFNMIRSDFSDASREDFDIWFMQLFRTYLSGRHQGPENKVIDLGVEHLTLVNEFLRRCLRLKRPIDKPQVKRWELLLAVEEELRMRCLKVGYDQTTGNEILEFNVNAFHPKGELSYRSMIFHERLDAATDDSSIITEEDMKKVFSHIMKDEGESFTEDAYSRAKKDLEEDDKIVLTEPGRYQVLERRKKDLEVELRNEFKKATRKESADCRPFYDWLKKDNSGFFLPPLKKKGTDWIMEVDVPSINTQGKRIMMQIPVYFWDAPLPDNATATLSRNKFSIVVMAGGNTVEDLKDVGMEVVVEEKGIFTSCKPSAEEPRCVFLIVSNEEVGDLKWLTWDDYTGHFTTLMELADEIGFKTPFPSIENQLKRYFNHRLDYIRGQTDLRWDENEYYGFRPRPFGRQKMTQYVELLSRVIREGRVKCDAKSEKLAIDLCGVYPWLRMADGNLLCKSLTACKYKYNGNEIDSVTNELMGLLNGQPKRLDDLADSMLEKTEKRHSIRDACDKKEKADVRSPIIILAHSLASAFPDDISIKDDSISKTSGTSAPVELDYELLGFFRRVFSTEDESLSRAVSDLLAGFPDGRPDALMRDLKSASSMIDDLKTNKSKAFLDDKVKSVVDNDDIERVKLLKRAEACATHVIDGLNKEYSAICRFDIEAVHSRISKMKKKIEEMTEDEAVDEDIRTRVAALKLGPAISNLDARVKPLQRNIESILKSARDPKGVANKSRDDWRELLGKDADLLVRIHAAAKNAILSENEVDKTEQDIGKEVVGILSTCASKMSALQSFINIVALQLSEKGRARIEEVCKSFAIPQNIEQYDKKSVEALSKALETAREGEIQIHDIAGSEIDESFDDGAELVEAYRELACKYAEKERQAREEFEEMLGKMNEWRPVLKERAMRAIQNRKADEFIESVRRSPRAQNDHYKDKAAELTKRSLSPTYRKLLDGATKGIKNRTLFAWLLQADSTDGGKKLREKLQFLNEMEKTGVMRYD